MFRQVPHLPEVYDPSTIKDFNQLLQQDPLDAFQFAMAEMQKGNLQFASFCETYAKQNVERINASKQKLHHGDGAQHTAHLNIQGFMCLYGLAPEKKDLQLAKNYFTLAAHQGSAYASYRLGRIYFDKESDAEENTKALFYLQQAADGGSHEAMIFLGDIYRKGLSFPKDSEKAQHYYQQAIAAGSLIAKTRLIDIYQLLDENPDKRNFIERKREILRKSAEIGHLHSMHLLGLVAAFHDQSYKNIWLQACKMNDAKTMATLSHFLLADPDQTLSPLDWIDQAAIRDESYTEKLQETLTKINDEDKQFHYDVMWADVFFKQRKLHPLTSEFFSPSFSFTNPLGSALCQLYKNYFLQNLNKKDRAENFAEILAAVKECRWQRALQVIHRGIRQFSRTWCFGSEKYKQSLEHLQPIIEKYKAHQGEMEFSGAAILADLKKILKEKNDILLGDRIHTESAFVQLSVFTTGNNDTFSAEQPRYSLRK